MLKFHHLELNSLDQKNKLLEILKKKTTGNWGWGSYSNLALIIKQADVSLYQKRSIWMSMTLVSKDTLHLTQSETVTYRSRMELEGMLSDVEHRYETLEKLARLLPSQGCERSVGIPSGNEEVLEPYNVPEFSVYIDNVLFATEFQKGTSRSQRKCYKHSTWLV